LLDGHFEHPAWLLDVVSYLGICDSFKGQHEFLCSLPVPTTVRGSIETYLNSFYNCASFRA
jgi:hypothetical protein